MDKVFAAILLLGALHGGGKHDALPAGCVPGASVGVNEDGNAASQARTKNALDCKPNAALAKNTDSARKRKLAKKATPKATPTAVAIASNRS